MRSPSRLSMAAGRAFAVAAHKATWHLPGRDALVDDLARLSPVRIRMCRAAWLAFDLVCDYRALGRAALHWL